MTMKHLTVVYRIQDSDAFMGEHQRIMECFNHEMGNKPWGITAMSLDHEIRRIELIEEAINLNDFDLVHELLEHTDVGNLQTLQELY